jgi:hypothetical protein
MVSNLAFVSCGDRMIEIAVSQVVRVIAEYAHCCRCVTGPSCEETVLVVFRMPSGPN